MEFKKESLYIYISIILLAVFTIYYLSVGNLEFLAYVLTIGILIYIIAKTDKSFNYLKIAKWGFVLWLLLHLFGGALRFNGIRLYDTVLIPIVGDPLFILRYDQAMHVLSYVVLTLFVFSMILHFADKNAKPFLVGFIAFLAGLGIGAINEIIEFGTVIFFNSTGVGNYYNNALDLIFNAIGALIAVFFMQKKKNSEEKRK